MKKNQKKRKPTVSRWQEQFEAYLLNHAHSLFSSLGRLSRSPYTSAMTVLVLAIVISLASGFYMVVSNIQQLTGNLQASNQISLFLQDNVTENQAMKLAEQLRQHAGIDGIKFISKKQALEEFKQNSGFADALKVLEVNPLPHVLQITPTRQLDSVDDINPLLTEFKQMPQVYLVQVDTQWMARVQAIMLIAKQGVNLIACLLGFAVTFITGNTIRLELQNRQDEVYISKLVGATHAFIQRPFLYTGLWLGLVSGFLGWLIVTLMLFIVKTPVETLSSLYNNQFELQFLSFSEFLILLASSAGLAMLGSWVVLNYQLRQLKPR